MPTFYRLLGFLRPYKRGLTISWGLASVAMVMTVLVPWLEPKFVPAIVTEVPTTPEVGLTLVMLGAGMVTVKLTPLLT